MEIFTHFVTFLIGLLGGYALKFAIDVRNNKKTTVSVTNESVGIVEQKSNKVGGHMAGRDVNTTSSGADK